MNPAFVSVMEKMHQALAHLQDVIPAAAGLKGVLASIRADLDTMVKPDKPEPEAEDAAADHGSKSPAAAAAAAARP